MYLYIQLDPSRANLCSEHIDTESDIITDGLLKQQNWLFSCSRHLSFKDDIPPISAGNADRKVEPVYDY